MAPRKGSAVRQIKNKVVRNAAYKAAKRDLKKKK
jgi:hypothetical protein